MEVVLNGLPPTSSGWKDSTFRILGWEMYFDTRLCTVRWLSSFIIAGTMRSMSERFWNGTWPSSSNPTSKISSLFSRKRS